VATTSFQMGALKTHPAQGRVLTSIRRGRKRAVGVRWAVPRNSRIRVLLLDRRFRRAALFGGADYGWKCGMRGGKRHAEGAGVYLDKTLPQGESLPIKAASACRAV